MKFASFRHGAAMTYGVAIGDELVALGSPGRTLRDALAGGVDSLVGAAGRALATEARIPVESVEFLPVIPNPGKIICVGVNYRTHREETGRDEVGHPTIFARFADTQIGHGQPAHKPAASNRFDYEGELAVVIGQGCRAVPASDAYDVIAGYSCYDDFSARDWQRHTSQWLPGKNFPGTGGFGPWLVTRDEIPDPGNLDLVTRVNGEVRQSASVADLIFGIPELIAYISGFTPLAPGDVIVTGTPGGVGLFMDPPTFLQAGDTVEVEITRLGTLRNTVVEVTA